MNRYRVQLLRYINLSDNLSARCRGITPEELQPLVDERLVDLPTEGYYGDYVRVSPIGKDFLAKIGADTFGNPEWDDDVFLGMMSRGSIHT